MASLNEHYRAARPSCDRSSEISVVLGKRIQGCATSNARFEPENYTGSHDGFNSVRAAATRDKKLPFSERLLVRISIETHKTSPDFDQTAADKAKNRIKQALGDIGCELQIKAQKCLASLMEEKLVTRISVLSTLLGGGKTPAANGYAPLIQNVENIRK